MLGVTDLPTYLIGLVLIVLLPGPNSLYVLSVAARRGVRAGYRAAMGVWCGDTVLMALSAAGVASLLQGQPVLFGIVNLPGLQAGEVHARPETATLNNKGGPTPHKRTLPTPTACL